MPQKIQTTHRGFLGAAERVLAEADEPLHYAEICRRALAKGWATTTSKNPANMLNARISGVIRKSDETAIFVRLHPGVFGLRCWLDEGKLDPAVTRASQRPLVPYYPLYDHVRFILPVWEGAQRSAITGMRSAIWEQSGTREQRVDWSDPDQWIDERLHGEDREWARRTWIGTKKRVNPRYVTGHWTLVNRYRLLETDASEHLVLSRRGYDFFDQPEGEVVREIDEDQGLLHILRLVAEEGTAAPGDLLGSWLEFLHAETNVRAESTARSFLYQRLKNLAHRGYAERKDREYSLTSEGLQYLEQAEIESAGEEPEESVMRQILRLQETMRETVRESVRDLLLDIDPYAFEHVIQQLLDAMGYIDTEVTLATHDKGVDVLGTIKVGITEVREVIQVKRQRSNVYRPVLDQLRGSLHRFDAVRGTIITIGGFAKGTRQAAFEPGASPITLIDGETLVQLLIEHNIGVKKKRLEFWELDADALSPDPSEPE